MILYILGALIKVVIGGVILLITFNKINPYQDFWYAILFFLLGSFLILWGSSFIVILVFVRFLFGKWFLSRIYRLSFFIGLYSIINFYLLFIDKRNKRLGLSTLLIFILLYYLIEKKNG